MKAEETIKVECGLHYYGDLTDDFVYVQKGEMLIFVVGRDYLLNVREIVHDITVLTKVLFGHADT